MWVVWWVLVLCVLLVAVPASFFAVYSFGRFAQRARGKPSAALPVAPDATALDRAVAPRLEEHPGRSGLLLVPDDIYAFAVRAHTARSAGRSLDLQYYYWDDDLTGGLLGREVVAAADRGVRVRLLLDDINTKGDDSAYLALDHHPNIEVRLFNPSRNRTSPLKRGIDLVLRASSATRRMHNKAWIADGRLGVVGGRNIGDAYFGAGAESNFRDLDLVLLGPAVGQTEAIFDAFWNSAAALPIHSFHRLRRRLRARASLPGLKAKLEGRASTEAARPYLDRVEEASAASMPAGAEAFHWIEGVEVVSDPPEKARAGQNGKWLEKTILPVLHAAQKNVEIISPYFIPGSRGIAALAGMTGRGVGVSVLTNSLAATDVMAVHGAYARYRHKLLRAGVQLFELRRDITQERASLFGSRGASLHTKAFTIDAMLGFVGSFNFDPRSFSLNTEMGVLFRDPGLAGEITGVFAAETAPDSAYRLLLKNGSLVWIDGEDGGRELHTEPKARLWRRIAAWAIGLLPIESQL